MKLDIRTDSVRTAMVTQAVDAVTVDQLLDAISATERWLADHPNDFVIERLQSQLVLQMQRARAVDLRLA
jgi:hypothetical protein